MIFRYTMLPARSFHTQSYTSLHLLMDMVIPLGHSDIHCMLFLVGWQEMPQPYLIAAILYCRNRLFLLHRQNQLHLLVLDGLCSELFCKWFLLSWASHNSFLFLHRID